MELWIAQTVLNFVALLLCHSLNHKLAANIHFSEESLVLQISQVIILVKLSFTIALTVFVDSVATESNHFA